MSALHYSCIPPAGPTADRIGQIPRTQPAQLTRLIYPKHIPPRYYSHRSAAVHILGVKLNTTGSNLDEQSHFVPETFVHTHDAIHGRILSAQPIGFLALVATMHYSVNPPAGAPEPAPAHASSTSAHHDGHHDSDHGSPAISPVGYHPPIDDEEARRRSNARAPPPVDRTADPRSAPPID